MNAGGALILMEISTEIPDSVAQLLSVAEQWLTAPPSRKWSTVAWQTEQRLRREAEQRRAEEERRWRELAARIEHIEDRRIAGLGAILAELDELGRLRRPIRHAHGRSSGRTDATSVDLPRLGKGAFSNARSSSVGASDRGTVCNRATVW